MKYPVFQYPNAYKYAKDAPDFRGIFCLEENQESFAPQQLQPQFPEQLPLSGQPIHFFPLFFALYTYHAARPTMATTMAMIKISTGFIASYFLRAYSSRSFLSERLHR